MKSDARTRKVLRQGPRPMRIVSGKSPKPPRRNACSPPTVGVPGSPYRVMGDLPKDLCFRPQKSACGILANRASTLRTAGSLNSGEFLRPFRPKSAKTPRVGYSAQGAVGFSAAPTTAVRKSLSGNDHAPARSGIGSNIPLRIDLDAAGHETNAPSRNKRGRRFLTRSLSPSGSRNRRSA
jgi:hypothetical protein